MVRYQSVQQTLHKPLKHTLESKECGTRTRTRPRFNRLVASQYGSYWTGPTQTTKTKKQTREEKREREREEEREGGEGRRWRLQRCQWWPPKGRRGPRRAAEASDSSAKSRPGREIERGERERKGRRGWRWRGLWLAAVTTERRNHYLWLRERGNHPSFKGSFIKNPMHNAASNGLAGFSIHRHFINKKNCDEQGLLTLSPLFQTRLNRRRFSATSLRSHPLPLSLCLSRLKPLGEDTEAFSKSLHGPPAALAGHHRPSSGGVHSFPPLLSWSSSLSLSLIHYRQCSNSGGKTILVCHQNDLEHPELPGSIRFQKSCLRVM